jgi:hypothetical protein
MHECRTGREPRFLSRLCNTLSLTESAASSSHSPRRCRWRTRPPQGASYPLIRTPLPAVAIHISWPLPGDRHYPQVGAPQEVVSTRPPRMAQYLSTSSCEPVATR